LIAMAMRKSGSANDVFVLHHASRIRAAQGCARREARPKKRRRSTAFHPENPPSSR
jgi:hypothetical protein